jgi:hypothetical protein
MSHTMIRTPSHRRNRRQDGTASIEFAILAPILFLLVIGGANYGMFSASESWLYAAARVGGEYLRVDPDYTAFPTCVVSPPKLCTPATSFVDNYTVVPGLVSPLLSTSIVCTCADNSSETASCPPTGAVSPCSGVVAGDARVFVYMTVTAQVKGYTPMFCPPPKATCDGFFSSSRVLSAKSTIRSQ